MEQDTFESTLYSNYDAEKPTFAATLRDYSDPLLNVVRKCEQDLLRRRKQEASLRSPFKVYKQLDMYGDHHYLFR